jgi:hypothetical protein
MYGGVTGKAGDSLPMSIDIDSEIVNLRSAISVLVEAPRIELGSKNQRRRNLHA